MITLAKRRKKESNYLKEYDVTILTGAEQTEHFNNNSDVECYWKWNAFFIIMDKIISNMKSRFSTESLQIATSTDYLLQFNYDNSLYLIDH